MCSVTQSCLTLCDPVDNTASQAPLCMGFFSQEDWSELPFPPPGDLPNPGMDPASPVSPALTGRIFTTEPPGMYVSHLGSKLTSVDNQCWHNVGNIAEVGGDGGINVIKLGFNCSPSKTSLGIFPVVQWLRLHLPTQRVRLRSLARELRFYMPHGQKQTTTKTYNQYCNKFNKDHLKWSTSNNMFKKKCTGEASVGRKGKLLSSKGQPSGKKTDPCPRIHSADSVWLRQLLKAKNLSKSSRQVSPCVLFFCMLTVLTLHDLSSFCKIFF